MYRKINESVISVTDKMNNLINKTMRIFGRFLSNDLVKRKIFNYILFLQTGVLLEHKYNEVIRYKKCISAVSISL